MDAAARVPADRPWHTLAMAALWADPGLWAPVRRGFLRTSQTCEVIVLARVNLHDELLRQRRSGASAAAETGPEYPAGRLERRPLRAQLDQRSLPPAAQAPRLAESDALP